MVRWNAPFSYTALSGYAAWGISSLYLYFPKKECKDKHNTFIFKNGFMFFAVNREPQELRLQEILYTLMYDYIRVSKCELPSEHHGNY